MRCLVAVTIVALGGTAAAGTIWIDGSCGDDSSYEQRTSDGAARLQARPTEYRRGENR